jgi:hypothetical protein
MITPSFWLEIRQEDLSQGRFSPAAAWNIIPAAPLRSKPFLWHRTFFRMMNY